MTVRKFLVIGQCNVNGVSPGGEVELDDETPGIHVQALIEAGHITEIQDPPKESRVRGKLPKGDD